MLYLAAAGGAMPPQAAMLEQLFQLALTYAALQSAQADYYMLVDEARADYTAAEENDHVVCPAPMRRRINQITDREARQMTWFTKAQLRILYQLFSLPTDATGHISIQAGNGNQNYRFHGEEVFLFALTKMALGQDTIILCMFFFGGAPQRWSSAYPWFLRYLDNRYSNLLSFDGPRRYVVFFSIFCLLCLEEGGLLEEVGVPFDGKCRVDPWHIPCSLVCVSFLWFY